MSNAVFYVRNARWGVGTGNTEFVDAVTEGQFRSQPQEMFGRYNMGATAEKIAETLGITREEQDAFSFASQQKAIAAIDAGKFKDEIVPVVVPQGRKKPPIVFDTDEFPKRDTSMEKMGKLKPCFNITTDDQGRIYNSSELTGTVTAASSSGRNDGASCHAADDRGEGKGTGSEAHLPRSSAWAPRAVIPAPWVWALSMRCPRR